MSPERLAILHRMRLEATRFWFPKRHTPQDYTRLFMSWFREDAGLKP